VNSFLRDIEKKFIVLESSEYCDQCDKPIDQCECDTDEIDEISTTSSVAGYQTPNAFAKADDDTVEVLGYKRVNESVNTSAGYSMKDERYQRPESEEEEGMDKFPFAETDSDWRNRIYVYPTVDQTDTPGIATKKHKTLRVEDVLEQKYEKLIEGYRDFATGDKNLSPERKVKATIQEIAKKLHEIETLVNYNSRLKNEAGVTSSAYGPSTNKALSKISEKLIKISERIRSLGE
jgi:hypothetical protein